MKGLDALNDDDGPGENPEVIEVIDGEAGPLNGKYLPIFDIWTCPSVSFWPVHFHFRGFGLILCLFYFSKQIM